MTGRGYHWISNGDPPKYVWLGDVWYNQKNKRYYRANTIANSWILEGNELIEGEQKYIAFPKKTVLMENVR